MSQLSREFSGPIFALQNRNIRWDFDTLLSKNQRNLQEVISLLVDIFSNIDKDVRVWQCSSTNERPWAILLDKYRLFSAYFKHGGRMDQLYSLQFLVSGYCDFISLYSSTAPASKKWFCQHTQIFICGWKIQKIIADFLTKKVFQTKITASEKSTQRRCRAFGC